MTQFSEAVLSSLVVGIKFYHRLIDGPCSIDLAIGLKDFPDAEVLIPVLGRCPVPSYCVSYCPVGPTSISEVTTNLG